MTHRREREDADRQLERARVDGRERNLKRLVKLETIARREVEVVLDRAARLQLVLLYLPRVRAPVRVRDHRGAHVSVAVVAPHAGGRREAERLEIEELVNGLLVLRVPVEVEQLEHLRPFEARPAQVVELALLVAAAVLELVALPRRKDASEEAEVADLRALIVANARVEGGEPPADDLGRVGIRHALLAQ